MNPFESMLKFLMAIGYNHDGDDLKEWIKDLDFEPEELENLIEWANKANPVTISKIKLKPTSGMREIAIAQNCLPDGKTYFSYQESEGDNEDLALANLFKDLLSENTDGIFITADHISY